MHVMSENVPAQPIFEDFHEVEWCNQGLGEAP